ncbi:unnamed protein product [Ilex paraguariensis]|uniref:Uncharacterized protein n=1 Tax=Ilex paraguariensis TaxID=185542 RepID=A0ABC8QKY9_9AQUA
MEAVSLCKHDNKENMNILPFTAKQIDPVPSNLQSSSNNVKKRFRRPLRDITHLFKPPFPSTSAPFTDFQLSSAVSGRTLDCRKRKAANDNDSMQESRSKLLRMGFL